MTVFRQDGCYQGRPDALALELRGNAIVPERAEMHAFASNGPTTARGRQLGRSHERERPSDVRGNTESSGLVVAQAQIADQRPCTNRQQHLSCCYSG